MLSVADRNFNDFSGVLREAVISDQNHQAMEELIDSKGREQKRLQNNSF